MFQVSTHAGPDTSVALQRLSHYLPRSVSRSRRSSSSLLAPETYRGRNVRASRALGLRWD